MIIQKEVIGDVEVRLESTDNLFVRTNYGTHYVIARHLKDGRMTQQVFQDIGMARKYYDYFVDFFTHYKSYGTGKILGPKKELVRNVVTEKVVNKAPWYYSQGKKFEGLDILPRKVA